MTDAQAQQEQNGQSAEQVIASLDRDVRSGKDSSNTLSKNWDGDELRQEVEAQAKITQAFGQRAGKAIGDYASVQYQKAVANGDEEAIKNWGEGGSYRVALHTLAGGLTGGVAGAAGAGLSAASMPGIAEMIGKMDAPAAVKLGLEQVAAAALGAAAGGAQGFASAVNTDVNNRQLHDRERDWARENAQKFAKHYKEKTGQTVGEKQAERMLLGIGYRMTDASASKGPGIAGPAGDAVAVSFIAQNAGDLFRATAAERNDPGALGWPLTPEQLALPAAVGNPVLGLATAGVVGGSVVLAGAGAAATIAGAVDLWTAYRTASAVYSMGPALGTGMAIGGATYTSVAAISAFVDARNGADFANSFNQRFSYPGLGAATAVGGLSGMYGTAMFNWAGVPNSLGNLATLPGLIIRANSAATAKAVGSATQAGINSSPNRQRRS